MSRYAQSQVIAIKRPILLLFMCVVLSSTSVPTGAPCVESKSSSLTIAANYSSVVDYVDDELHRAQRMFDARAYLHWYKKYGCEDVRSQNAILLLITKLVVLIKRLWIFVRGIVRRQMPYMLSYDIQRVGITMSHKSSG